METVELSRKRICYLVDLVHRDEAKPVRRIRKNYENIFYCPSCKYIVAKTDHFCSKCGQRIDVNTIAF